LKRLALVLALPFTLRALPAAALETPSSEELVAAHRSADPLRLAARVRPLSASTLATLLTRGTMPERLAVARGARFASDPLTLLGPLAQTMAGGDPELAPVAARTLLVLVVESPLHLVREHSQHEVRTALAPALALRDNAEVRADLRAVAHALHAALEFGFPTSTAAP
jgi:hypothetical protein